MAFREAFGRFPCMETERLQLRQLQPADAADLQQLYAEPEVTRWLDWDGPEDVATAGMVIELFGEQYRKRENLRWGIVSQASGKLIGTVILSHFRKQSLTVLGYDLARADWGKGYMAEALQSVIRYAWETMELLRIEAYVRPENAASSRLLQKCGFELEGQLRSAGYHEDRHLFYDVLLYALLNPAHHTR